VCLVSFLDTFGYIIDLSFCSSAKNASHFSKVFFYVNQAVLLKKILAKWSLNILEDDKLSNGQKMKT